MTLSSKFALALVTGVLWVGSASAEQIQIGYSAGIQKGKTTPVGCVYVQVTPDSDPKTDNVASIDMVSVDEHEFRGSYSFSEMVNGREAIWRIVAQRSKGSGRLNVYASIQAGKSRNSFDVAFSRDNELVFPVTGTSLGLGQAGDTCYRALLNLGPAR